MEKRAQQEAGLTIRAVRARKVASRKAALG